MPQCVVCETVQARLNDGDLCRLCFSDKDTEVLIKANYNNDESSNGTNKCLPSIEKGMIDLIKENMIQEKKWNLEITELLKDQINYLKNDIIHKNTIIESLMVDLSNKKSESTFEQSTPAPTGIINSCDMNDAIGNVKNTNTSDIYSFDANKSFNYKDWQKVKSNKKNNTFKPNVINEKYDRQGITYTNRYQALFKDKVSDYDRELENNPDISEEQVKRQLVYNPVYKRSNPIVNQYPQNDTIKYNYVKSVPGNSSYANMANDGKKILILTDSICSRLQMRNFNNFITNGSAYRKTFPGATPKELSHYCTHTLIKDKPDTCIINVGTNSLNKDKPSEICDDIIDIVKLCHSYGVNKVYVSAISYRPQLQHSVRDINNLLIDNQMLYNYELIHHDNINAEHIWKDKVHLNNKGLSVIANNFINAINREHIA